MLTGTRILRSLCEKIRIGTTSKSSKTLELSGEWMSQDTATGNDKIDSIRYEKLRQARQWFHSLTADEVEKVFDAIVLRYPSGTDVVRTTRKLWLRHSLKDEHVLSLYQAYVYFCTGPEQTVSEMRFG